MGDHMEISKPNEWGAMEASHAETVARYGRCSASADVALCEDGLYRQSASIMYSYIGHASPVFMSTSSYSTLAEAIDAGIDELLETWLGHHHWEPKSAQDELVALRQQIEARRRQPSLFKRFFTLAAFLSVDRGFR